MTAEQLAAIAGIVASLVFSYVPGVNTWYDALVADYKRALMGLLLLGVAGATFALSCGGILAVVECTQAGALGLVQILITALVANQATYLISPKGQ